jgi:hypothetical protein
MDAAEEVAVYDNRLSSFELRLTRIEGSLSLLTWTIGAMVTLIAFIGGPILWLTLKIAGKIEFYECLNLFKTN